MCKRTPSTRISVMHYETGPTNLCMFTKDSDGEYHSFDDRPAFCNIKENSYIWYNHGVVSRDCLLGPAIVSPTKIVYMVNGEILRQVDGKFEIVYNIDDTGFYKFNVNGGGFRYYVNGGIINSKREGALIIDHNNGEKVICVFENDKLIKVSELKKYTGEYKSYYRNGQLQTHCFYKDGKLKGEYKTCYLGGQLKTFYQKKA